MQVKTAREYDEAGKVHIREAVCPYCGKLNWLVEEMRSWCHDYCEHLQRGDSSYRTFVFREVKNEKSKSAGSNYKGQES